MYRALYEYRTDLKNYLSFETGDQFTIIDQKQKDWYLAQNGYGEIGYIPKNYMIREEVGQPEVLMSIDRAIEVIHYQAGSKGGQYTHAQRENLRGKISALRSIDRAIEVIHYQAGNKGGQYTHAQRENLSKLIQHRKSVVESYTNHPRGPENNQPEQSVKHDDNVQLRNKSVRRVAPVPPNRVSSIENKPNEITTSSTSIRSSAIDSAIDNSSAPNSAQEGPVVVNTSSVQDVQCKDKRETVDSASSPVNFPSTDSSASAEIRSGNSDLVDLSAITIQEGLGNELIESVRKNTGLSYQTSMVAVETVLGHIGMKVPEVSPVLDRIFTTLHVSQAGQVEEESSSDYERLQELFNELAECKDDSQQRGWALHEDEAIINNNLEELLSILENAKESISKKAISGDSYECVHNLVQYYQMETRVPIRLTLLKIFNAMCVLDVTVVSLLLFSILTTELAEELQRNIDDIKRSSYVSLALSMLFSTGDTVPANIHDHLNLDFLRFIFDTLESPPSDDHEEHLSDLLVNFILAFNLHFQSTEENMVMKVMAEKNTVKVFSEKILLIFNRGEDPVVMFEHHESQAPNSVMKLLQDMYSDPKTSSVIYTNDEKVLIDIILGHLVDLSPGDQKRTCQLQLMKLFLTNSDYGEHKHRLTELISCLQRILDEEEEVGEDQTIVAFMFKHCSVLV